LLKNTGSFSTCASAHLLREESAGAGQRSEGGQHAAAESAVKRRRG
jgi:hypothetical protein